MGLEFLKVTEKSAVR